MVKFDKNKIVVAQRKNAVRSREKHLNVLYTSNTANVK